MLHSIRAVVAERRLSQEVCEQSNPINPIVLGISCGLGRVPGKANLFTQCTHC